MFIQFLQKKIEIGTNKMSFKVTKSITEGYFDQKTQQMTNWVDGVPKLIIFKRH